MVNTYVTRIKHYSENKVIIMFEEKKPWYYNHPIWYGLLLGVVIKLLGEVYDKLSLVKAGDLILQVMSVILIIFIIYIVFDTFKTPKRKESTKSPYG